MKNLLCLLLIFMFNAVVTVAVGSDISVTADTVIENNCYGGSSAAIQVSVDGGTAPYTYLWNGPGEQTWDTEDIT